MSLRARLEIQYKLMWFFGNKTALVQKIEKAKSNSTENIDEVKRIITKYGLDIKSRKREILYARHLVMWYLCYNTKMTLTAIGKLFERDHATVLNSKKQVENFISLKVKDKEFREAVEGVDNELREIFNITPNI
jgi:chromosomal replication initiation ATPase DnaA